MGIPRTLQNVDLLALNFSAELILYRNVPFLIPSRRCSGPSAGVHRCSQAVADDGAASDSVPTFRCKPLGINGTVFKKEKSVPTWQTTCGIEVKYPAHSGRRDCSDAYTQGVALGLYYRTPLGSSAAEGRDVCRGSSGRSATGATRLPVADGVFWRCAELREGHRRECRTEAPRPRLG